MNTFFYSLDVDGDNSVTETDGMLIYEFLKDNLSLDSKIDIDSKKTSAEIIAYLYGLKPFLNVSGTHAEIDGILIKNYIDGARQQDLISGIGSEYIIEKSLDEIESSIQALYPKKIDYNEATIFLLDFGRHYLVDLNNNYSAIFAVIEEKHGPNDASSGVYNSHINSQIIIYVDIEQYKPEYMHKIYYKNNWWKIMQWHEENGILMITAYSKGRMNG